MQSSKSLNIWELKNITKIKLKVIYFKIARYLRRVLQMFELSSTRLAQYQFDGYSTD